MLPILFSITLQTSWAIYALIAAAIATGAWQWRGARKAGETPKAALKTFGNWTVGSAVLFYVAVKVLDGQDLFHLVRPIVIPLHTYGLLVASAFLVAMSMAGRAAERSGLDRERVMDLSFWILLAAMVGSRV